MEEVIKYLNERIEIVQGAILQQSNLLSKIDDERDIAYKPCITLIKSKSRELERLHGLLASIGEDK